MVIVEGGVIAISPYNCLKKISLKMQVFTVPTLKEKIPNIHVNYYISRQSNNKYMQ